MWARLRRRPLDLYLLYRALALTWVFMPFQVLYLQAQGLSLATIFDLNVVFSLATVVFEVPTGVFADRRGRRVAMAAGGLVMAAGCALCVVGGDAFWVYALAQVLFALSMTLASGADSAYLYDYLTERGQADDYKRYEGLGTAAKGVGNLLAVLVGGVLYWAAPRSVFALTAVLTAGASLLALALPAEPHVRHRETALQNLARASRTLARDGRLLAVLGFGAITFVLLRIPLFADQAHLEVHLRELTAADVGLAAAALAAAKEVGDALVASNTDALSRRVSRRGLVVGLAAVLVAIYVVMSYGHGVACLAMMVLLSSCYGLFSPLMRDLMNSLIASRDRATLLSFESMGRRILFALVSPLFGRGAESATLHAAFSGTAWVAGVAYVALAAAALGALRTAAAAPARATSARSTEPRSALASVG